MIEMISCLDQITEGLDNIETEIIDLIEESKLIKQGVERTNPFTPFSSQTQSYKITLILVSGFFVGKNGRP